MFYSKEPDLDKLRFGDVIKGNYLTSLFFTKRCNETIFKMEVNILAFNVILTPCCSIRDGCIVITPLIEVKSSFFNNPFFAEDLLNINKISTADKHFPPNIWENMSNEEKDKKLSQGVCYPFTDLFIYASSDIYSKYSVNNRQEGKINNINHYMIDFKNTFNLKIENMQNSKNMLIKSKVLELSVDSRKELNYKIKAFYRIAEEDLIIN